MKDPFIILRDRKAQTEEFRKSANDVAHTLAKEVARHTAPPRKVILVPILRAGLALLPAFVNEFPKARVGFIGLKRDEKTLKPKA